MEEIIKGLADFGFSALFAGILILFIMKLNNEHRTERTEWKSEMVESNKRYDERQKETNAILMQLHSVIERVTRK